MKACRGTLAALVLLCWGGEAPAQLVVPGPAYLPGFYYTSGIGASYRSGRLRIGAFVGTGLPAVAAIPAPAVVLPGPVFPGPIIFPVLPFNQGFLAGPGPVAVIPGGVPIVGFPTVPLYGYSDVRINIVPQLVVSGGRGAIAEDYDTRGVDLDVLVPGRKLGIGLEQEAKAAPPVAKPQAAAAAPAKDKPAAPPAKLPLVPPALPADLAEPRSDPVQESMRLVSLGLLAFNAGEYGLAAQRLHQATASDPTSARAYLLLAQAQAVLGRFEHAVKSIEAGMRRQANYAVSGFVPRTELFKGGEADWDAERKLLENLHKKEPKNPVFLFLLAHQMWFDGERPAATKLFQQLRPLVADPFFVDVFLTAAGPKLAAVE